MAFKMPSKKSTKSFRSYYTPPKKSYSSPKKSYSAPKKPVTSSRSLPAPKPAPVKAPYVAPRPAPPPKVAAKPTPITERPRPATKTINTQLKAAPITNKTINTQIAARPAANKTINNQLTARPAANKTVNTEIRSPVVPNKLGGNAASAISKIQKAAQVVAGGGGSSGYGGGSRPVAPVSANPNPAVRPPTVVAPSAPATPVTGGNSGQGSGGGSFNTVGSGRGRTFGQLQRLRNQRGPQQGLSMTPEMLRRLAASRFSRQ